MAVSNEIDANEEFDYHDNEAADGIEHIYCNIDIIDTQNSVNKTKELITKGIPLATYPGTERSGRKSTRGVAVCLGLLSVLLLAGVIGLLIYYNREMDSFKEKINQFQTRYNNMTEERDQFQTRYNDMTAERDQFQTRCNEMNAERAQFQTRCNEMNAERDQFQTRYNDMTAERDQFQTRYNDMTKERDQFLVERDNPMSNLSLVKQYLQQGWRYFNSSLYFVSTETKTWEDSRRDCEEKTADLLIIKSREEQVFLHGLNNQVFWIGLTDKEHKDKWMWVDDTELTTGYWAGGQPDNYYGIKEDCATRMSGESIAEKSWHDAACNQRHFWMCEKKVQL